MPVLKNKCGKIIGSLMTASQARENSFELANPVLMGGLFGFRQLSEMAGHDESRLRLLNRTTGFKSDRCWKDYRKHQYKG